MLKNEMENHIAELEKELQEKDMLIDQLSGLKGENDRLRDQIEMANNESKTSSMEINRISRKLTSVFEAQLNTLNSIEGSLNMSKEILQSAMQEEKVYTEHMEKVRRLNKTNQGGQK